MKVKDVRAVLDKKKEKGQRFNIMVRPKMGLLVVLDDVTIRRGPQYVKKDGSFTIRAGMRGHKESIKVKVHEIVGIMPKK
jgi:hypothetical protein